jgi:hypothetical protein
MKNPLKALSENVTIKAGSTPRLFDGSQRQIA